MVDNNNKQNSIQIKSKQ